MKNKERYYKAFIENDGKLNEIDLGEKIFLNEDETRKIISQLISEHKITYKDHRACSYKLIKNIQ